MWLKVIVACVPAVLAILVDELFEGLKATEETVIISLTLVVYGVLFIVIENLNKNKTPPSHCAQPGHVIGEELQGQTFQALQLP